MGNLEEPNFEVIVFLIDLRHVFDKLKINVVAALIARREFLLFKQRYIMAHAVN